MEVETPASSIEEAIEEVITSVVTMHKEEKQKKEERKEVYGRKVEGKKRKEEPVKAFDAVIVEVVTACFLVVRANGKVKTI